MLRTFTCARESMHCLLIHTADLGEVIEHLRLEHWHSRSIQRPDDDVPDSEGYIWYCHACEAKPGNKKRRKCCTHDAMWDHLSACHGEWIEDVVIG
jgi:hypothetical protein